MWWLGHCDKVYELIWLWPPGNTDQREHRQNSLLLLCPMRIFKAGHSWVGLLHDYGGIIGLRELLVTFSIQGAVKSEEQPHKLALHICDEHMKVTVSL